MELEGEVNGAGGAETEVPRTKSLKEFFDENKEHGASQVETAESATREEKSTSGAVDVGTISGAEQPGQTYSVILFGRTGSGKSTLVQMLTLGKLDPDSKKFASSSGIRGQTKEVRLGEGRDWSVLDTPGFGEPKDQLSTISSDEAEKKIKKYLQMMEGTYTHFLYLVMKDRIDELDRRLWTFFVRLCGDAIKTNFSVVISNASRQWLEQNLSNLKLSFEGCENFLSAEFPPTKSDDQEWEAELQSIRMESLTQLEDALKRLDRTPVKCDFDDGFWKMTSNQISSSGATLKRFVKSFLETAVSFLQFTCLIKLLHQDGKYLVPEFGGRNVSPTRQSGSNA